MRAFALVAGDFVLGDSGYATVTGSQKVVQDLGLAMREPFACDRFHPRWGSVLPNYVGEPIDEQTAMLVRSECSRLIRNYIMIQGGVIEEDVKLKRASRLTTEEVVTGVDGIDIRQNQDEYHIRVRLVLASGNQVNLTGTVS